MKCELCNENIETTFLEKIIGTYVKIKGKKKLICNSCQRKYSIQEIKEKLS